MISSLLLGLLPVASPQDVSVPSLEQHLRGGGSLEVALEQVRALTGEDQVLGMERLASAAAGTDGDHRSLVTSLLELADQHTGAVGVAAEKLALFALGSLDHDALEAEILRRVEAAAGGDDRMAELRRLTTYVTVLAEHPRADCLTTIVSRICELSGEHGSPDEEISLAMELAGLLNNAFQGREIDKPLELYWKLKVEAAGDEAVAEAAYEALADLEGRGIIHGLDPYLQSTFELLRADDLRRHTLATRLGDQRRINEAGRDFLFHLAGHDPRDCVSALRGIDQPWAIVAAGEYAAELESAEEAVEEIVLLARSLVRPPSPLLNAPGFRALDEEEHEIVGELLRLASKRGRELFGDARARADLSIARAGVDTGDLFWLGHLNDDALTLIEEPNQFWFDVCRVAEARQDWQACFDGVRRLSTWDQLRVLESVASEAIDAQREDVLAKAVERMMHPEFSTMESLQRRVRLKLTEARWCTANEEGLRRDGALEQASNWLRESTAPFDEVDFLWLQLAEGCFEVGQEHLGQALLAEFQARTLKHVPREVCASLLHRAAQAHVRAGDDASALAGLEVAEGLVSHSRDPDQTRGQIAQTRVVAGGAGKPTYMAVMEAEKLERFGRAYELADQLEDRRLGESTMIRTLITALDHGWSASFLDRMLEGKGAEFTDRACTQISRSHLELDAYDGSPRSFDRVTFVSTTVLRHLTSEEAKRDVQRQIAIATANAEWSTGRSTSTSFLDWMDQSPEVPNRAWMCVTVQRARMQAFWYDVVDRGSRLTFAEAKQGRELLDGLITRLSALEPKTDEERVEALGQWESAIGGAVIVRSMWRLRIAKEGALRAYMSLERSKQEELYQPMMELVQRSL